MSLHNMFQGIFLQIRCEWNEVIYVAWWIFASRYIYNIKFYFSLDFLVRNICVCVYGMDGRKGVGTKKGEHEGLSISMLLFDAEFA